MEDLTREKSIINVWSTNVFWICVTALCFVLFLVALIPVSVYFVSHFSFWYIVRKFYPYHLFLKGNHHENDSKIKYMAANFKKYDYLIERHDVPMYGPEHGFLDTHYATIGLNVRFRREADAVLFRISML